MRNLTLALSVACLLLMTLSLASAFWRPRTRNIRKQRPVNGGWSAWSPFRECSETCGGGVQFRTRRCTRPKPAYGGRNCKGNARETRPCNTQPCPMDGGWSSWSEFGTCSKTCGGGTQTRSRTCTNPIPGNGGRDCEGNSLETRACNSQDCPVDGGWSSWGEFGTCSKSCGGGTQKRSRTCTNPQPGVGGRDCEGNSQETRVCNAQNCPRPGCDVKGKWFAEGRRFKYGRQVCQCKQGKINCWRPRVRSNNRGATRYRFNG